MRLSSSRNNISGQNGRGGDEGSSRDCRLQSHQRANMTRQTISEVGQRRRGFWGRKSEAAPLRKDHGVRGRAER
jgi:hypothetical protein